MNKYIGLHIASILFFCCTLQSIQAITNNNVVNIEIVNDTLNIDTTNITPRNFNNLKEKYNGNDYVYERNREKSGWWSRLKQWINDKIQNLFNIKNKGQASKITDIAIKTGGVILFILVIYFIFRAVVNKEGSWIFGKSSDKNIIPVTDLETNIHTTNFLELIADAEHKLNYRLAIRYYYLWLLKKLATAELINYDVEKTNNDYKQEIENQQLKDEFNYTSYLYNYIWYGEFDVNDEQFNKAKQAFVKFINSIKE